ncbi:MAG TPA: FecR domain-containing protein [Dokdonella sp.]|nr:FecR domain-containing protein [Dokdonella sp.]
MHDSRRIEQVAAEWLTRRDRGDWSAHEQRALEDWLGASTRHRVTFLRLQAAWSEAGRLQALAAGLRDDAVPPRGAWVLGPVAHALVPHEVAAARRAPAPERPGHRWHRALAAGVALVAVGAALWFAWQLGGRSEADYASTLGQLRTVALADGSSAILSSDSRVHVRMTRGERDIELLQGEAYFEVAHDAGRPFVVSADGRRAIAVGTRFSVRRDAHEVRVVVTEGKVRLDAPPGADGRATPVSLLPAGSVATAGRSGVLVRSLPVAEAERFLEWRSGFLTFDDASLANAAAEFNRFNTRKLELADAGVGELRVGGNFRWANLDGFVKLLEMGFPVRAERLPDRIVLHAR